MQLDIHLVIHSKALYSLHSILSSNVLFEFRNSPICIREGLSQLYLAQLHTSKTPS
jgi:hypothetical protein